MKFYTIEVDEKVWNYLKKNAEPFKDTPNSVLNRIIFESRNTPVSKISQAPEPREKQLTEIDLNNEFTVDGIKLELETHDNEEIKEDGLLLGTSKPYRSDDMDELKIEFESKFESNRKPGAISLDSSSTFKPDKDIDDFINELEKSNASSSIRDEFSNMLKEIPANDGEWTEISVKPKQDLTLDNPPHAIRPSVKEPARILKPQSTKNYAKPPEKKKPKLISLEDKLVYSLGERLKNQWGEFRQEGVGLLIFANKTVLCKYSKYDETNTRWFWGVSQADRYAWGPQNWLALILENEDQKSYSFLLFNSQESGVLFDQCRQTAGDKYINMLIDDAYESPRIQEWRHLDLRNRKKALPIYIPDDE